MRTRERTMRSERGEVGLGIILLLAAGLSAAGLLIGGAAASRARQMQSVGGVNGAVGWDDIVVANGFITTEDTGDL